MSRDADIEVRLVTPEETPLLIALIRRCYGESYIDPSFYERDTVRGRLASGSLSSIGAFTEDTELVGHMGITRRPHGGITADAGMTLVDPAHRGEGIARKVAGGLAKQAIAMGLVGVHDYPVTVHGATQRIGRGFGVDTGLMLANVPADVVFEQMETRAGGARSSSLIRWLPFGQAPERTVYLPERYRSIIERLYAASYLERTNAGGGQLPNGSTTLESSFDARRRILRIDLAEPGEDLSRDLQRALDAPAYTPLVAHVDLRLGHPATPAATTVLRDLGFFFAGILPELHHGDVLRLQRLDSSIEVDTADVIASDSTRAIERFVMEDRP